MNTPRSLHHGGFHFEHINYEHLQVWIIIRKQKHFEHGQQFLGFIIRWVLLSLSHISVYFDMDQDSFLNH